MLPIILLCVLLQAFSTCSLLHIDDQPHNVSYEDSIIENFKAAYLDVYGDATTAYYSLDKLVALRRAAEMCWSTCVDNVSTHPNSQSFLKNALPGLLDYLDSHTRPSTSAYTTDTLVDYTKIFYEERSYQAYVEDIVVMAKCSNGKIDPFQGLSDEFLSFVAESLRSTINIRKIFYAVRGPHGFIGTGTGTQSPDDPAYQAQLVAFLMHLRDLINGLQKTNPTHIHHDLVNALRVAKSTMAPANKALLKYLTDFYLRYTPVLAEEVRKAISLPSKNCGLSTSANNILSGIEAITVPLYRSSFDLYRELAEQQGRGEVLWDKLFESLLAFESIFAKPGFDSIKQVSETLSELIDHLLDTFLKGEDELWTLGLQAKLSKTIVLWGRAQNYNFPSDREERVQFIKYAAYLDVDAFLTKHILGVVDKLEESSTFDRATREKFVEFWNEAQALSRLVRSLFILQATVENLESTTKSVSSVLDEQINVLQRQGIKFQVGKYHQFINELPEHQEAVARLLKRFSDGLSSTILNDFIVDAIDQFTSPSSELISTTLKRSLKQLFRGLSRPTKPQSLPSRTTGSRNKNSKGRGGKSKGNVKSRKAAISRAPAPTSMQAFLPRPGSIRVDGQNLPEENFEESWTLVSKSQSRQAFGSLANHSAWEVLRQFANKPLGWDEIPPTDPQDMRRDKQKVKIAAFNVEWLFLFDLSTDKLYGKIKWKSLKEAWDHIRDVADAIRKIDADIICLCEVQDLRILSILVELLPELGYRAYLIPSHDSLGQNVGILTRVDTHVSISKIEDWSFPKNIVLHLKLDNGWGDLVDLVVTGVHLISSTAESDRAERARHREGQARALKRYLAANYGTSEQIVHLVLGDFNMVDPGLPSAQSADAPEEALQVLKHEEFNLFNAMGPRSTPSDSSSLPSGVCHIFTSHPELVADAQIVGLDGDGAACRLERVSDHPPVVATINLPKHNY